MIALRSDDPRRRKYGRGYEYVHRLLAGAAFGTARQDAKVFALRPSKPRVRGNIVVCATDAYVKLVQRRARALDESGRADWRWCIICATWDHPYRLRERINGGMHSTFHPECSRWYAAARSHKLSVAKGPRFHAAALEWGRTRATERGAAAERRQRHSATKRDTKRKRHEGNNLFPVRVA